MKYIIKRIGRSVEISEALQGAYESCCPVGFTINYLKIKTMLKDYKA